MAQFWLATFDPPRARSGPSDGDSTSLPGENEGAPLSSGLAVMVIKEAEDIAVLFCTVNDPHTPAVLSCIVGFLQAPAYASWGQDLGFPLVDVIIRPKGGSPGLDIVCPAFGTSAAMDYSTSIASVDNVIRENMGAPATSATWSASSIAFHQTLSVPDCVFPATWLVERPIVWPLPEGSASPLPLKPIRITVTATRYPQLRPFRNLNQKPETHVHGTINLQTAFANPVVGDPVRVARAPAFGRPAFRFRDVEVLGFRIDLGRHGAVSRSHAAQRLRELCEPLNFHLQRNEQLDPLNSSVSDFSYRPASLVLSLELLRYGKMALQERWGGVRPTDYQSQHELILRILVGRVDDDTAQARDPAVFVPAIFVDNAWSKFLGRTLQGFQKEMAEFCVTHRDVTTPLGPDGRLPKRAKPEALHTISEIRLTGRASPATLLELHCQGPRYSGWDEFNDIDLAVAYSPFALAPTRWRPHDFDDSTFESSFSRAAVSRSLHGLRSIQVSPVTPPIVREKLKVDSSWITGTLEINPGAQIAWPDGLVTLELSAPPEAPAGWKVLCELLGADAGSARVTLNRGNWYRMRCSIDLLIDDMI